MIPPCCATDCPVTPWGHVGCACPDCCPDLECGECMCTKEGSAKAVGKAFSEVCDLVDALLGGVIKQ